MAVFLMMCVLGQAPTPPLCVFGACPKTHIRKNIYLLLSTISTMSAIYSPMIGMFSITIFCNKIPNMAVMIVTPIPIPTPLAIPANKFRFMISFLSPQ